MPRALPVLPLLALSLVACAPAQTVRGQAAQTGAVGTGSSTTSTSSPAAVFMPGGQQLAVICASRGRVQKGGRLVWNDGPTLLSRPAPYLLSCYDYTIQNDGHLLSVQDDTLAKALTRFDPDTGLLRYFPGLSVTFPKPGLVSADSGGTVPDSQRAALSAVSVRATQAGQPDATVVENGAVTAQRFDPSQPLTLRFSGAVFPWPEVTVQASKGRITVPVGGS